MAVNVLQAKLRNVVKARKNSVKRGVTVFYLKFLCFPDLLLVEEHPVRSCEHQLRSPRMRPHGHTTRCRRDRLPTYGSQVREKPLLNVITFKGPIYQKFLNKNHFFCYSVSFITYM